MGRGLGGIALTDGRPNVFVNPAGLSRIGPGTTMLGYSMLRTDLAELPPVHWDSNRDGRINHEIKLLAIITEHAMTCDKSPSQPGSRSDHRSRRSNNLRP